MRKLLSHCVAVAVLLASPLHVCFGQDLFQSLHHTELPANGGSCSECHAVPVVGGSSKVSVARAGNRISGKYEGIEPGGILHKAHEDKRITGMLIEGLRVSLNLLGDGYVEAVDDAELRRELRKEIEASNGKIHGEVVELGSIGHVGQALTVGRFGWKSQHASVVDASADALFNELGIPNRIFGEDRVEAKWKTQRDETGASELDEIVKFIRASEPIAPDSERSLTEWARAGAAIFDRIGCAICHVRTLRTAPPGALVDGGALRVDERLGNREIHPFSDYLLHDVGTGDGIVQNVRPEDYAESTANKFRTAPLWGVRYRSWLMHDGKSVTYHQAIMRHAGEASGVVEEYEKLTPVEKEQLRQFLDSL